MWQDYDKYEAGFSAGDHVSNDGARRKIEEEMDIMGIWDAVELGRQLDAELDGTPDLAREDDSLLAEVLAALDASDAFDTSASQLDSQKMEDWYPYSSKTIDAVIQECANPDIRSRFHLYPEVNTNGPVAEIWHGEKLCNKLSPDLLTPMFDAGHGTQYYLKEIAQLENKSFVIPVRWIKVDKIMHVDVFPVVMDDEVMIFTHPKALSDLRVQNKAHVKTDAVRIPASQLVANFLDLAFKVQIPDWSETAIADGYPARMPNPLRSIAKGDPFYTILVDYFSDDVSGNRSKSWNKHWNAYMTNRSLPRQLLQHEFYVHFVSTSQHASIPEQFGEFQKIIKQTETDPIRVPDNTSSTGFSCYQIIVNSDPSDNPMQAEICSCMGAAANYPCRKCKVGGNKEDKATDEGYHAMFSCGEPRSKATILETVQKMIELACEGNETELKKMYTASGIKDKYTEYWINDILSQFKKQVDSGVSKETVTEALKKWVEDNRKTIYSAFLTTDVLSGFDPPRDTPIELLHTILLVCESLIGRQFKVLLQCAVFQIYDLVDENHFRAWKAVGELAALLWFPEIVDMEGYCADLHVAIANFLDSFAEIDPSKMITKVKTHLLTHAPTDVRLFGPLLGAITEAFESFNAVFRSCSILSNHRAPSRDIAIQLASQEGVKHRVAGGMWPLKGKDDEIIWAGVDEPILQRLLGWKKAELLAPGSLTLAPIPITKGQRGRPQRKAILLKSTQASLAFNCNAYDLNSEWYKCKNIVAQSQEICDTHSWIVSSSPVPQADAVMGRIVEILQKIDSAEGIVVLEQYVLHPDRHELFNMPVLCPKRREEAVFLILNPKANYSLLIVALISNLASTSNTIVRLAHERKETNLEESFIEHDIHVGRFLISTSSLHNPHLLRRILRPALIQPLPLWADRVLLHQKQAERLRTGRDTKKIKNAAAAEARRALKAAEGGSTTAAPIKPKKTAKKPTTGAKRKRNNQAGRKSKKRRIILSDDELSEPDSDSGSSDKDSDSSSEDSGSDDDYVERNVPAPEMRREGLRRLTSSGIFLVQNTRW
ncbi:hypothetical protein B0H13DRAFT_1935744 [Mycena leptocephala]|nr:hypothetical protein B0H13DRAFT_1935744 [Mycena leptocephala]